MATKTKKAKQPAFASPQTKEECNDYIMQLGELQRQQEELHIELNRKLAEVTAETTAKITPLVQQEEDLFKGIAAFASANRASLTDGGKTKTFKLPAGECNWRFSPYAVELTNPKEVLRILQKLKFKEFIRIKKEIDREAMLKDPESAQAVTGVKITREELFGVKPNSVSAEITRDSIKKSKPKKAKKKSTKKQENGEVAPAENATTAIRRKKPR